MAPMAESQHNATVSAELPRARHRTRARRRIILWGIAVVIAGVSLFAFARALDWRATLADLKRAHVGWLIVALLGHAMTLPLLTEQWTRLQSRQARLSWGVLWECVTIGMAMMNTLPFGGGHAVALGLLTRRGATLTGALSLLALEQLCDGVAKWLLLLVALLCTPLPPALQRATWVAAVLLVLGFVALFWLARHPEEGRWLGRWRAKWTAPLEAIRQPGVLAFAVGLSVVAKGFGLVAVYAAQRALGVELPFSSTPLVLAAVTFATLMALAPGSVGIFEIAAIAAYRLLGVPTEQAATLAIVQHACFLLPNIATGYVVAAWGAVKARRFD
jgi:uncharacterized membrane protein YbhN (UPF0104 family)